jgi:AraC-like DNA-binding protein
MAVSGKDLTCVMTFEFTTSRDFDFLQSFSDQFGIPVKGNELQIPAHLGQGSIRQVDLSEGLKLLIHQYTFREEFVLKRCAPDMISDFVTLIFYSSGFPNNSLSNREKSFVCTRVNTSSIEISSNDLNSEIRFPAGQEISFTVVGIKAGLLAELLSLSQPNQLVQTITSGTSSFLYLVPMTPDFEKTLRSIAESDDRDPLKKLFCRVRVQELFYLVFAKLVQRENKSQCSVNSLDVSRMKLVRETLLANLSEAPQLRDLARLVHMSETKMKMLFRQIFGDSIYNYYQTARMEEAASLLRHSGLPVAQVGYQLGFSNMSHFSRLFAKHHGRTPKKFQSVG